MTWSERISEHFNTETINRPSNEYGSNSNKEKLGRKHEEQNSQDGKGQTFTRNPTLLVSLNTIPGFIAANAQDLPSQADEPFVTVGATLNHTKGGLSNRCNLKNEHKVIVIPFPENNTIF